MYSHDRLGVYRRVCGGTINFERPDGSFYGLSPRVRGNQALIQGPDDSLSPRVRGNRAPKVLDSVAYRSIPACAGEPTCGSI